MRASHLLPLLVLGQAIANMEDPIKAPDLDVLKLPDTSNVARRTRELAERQTPSRKKRLRTKNKRSLP